MRVAILDEELPYPPQTGKRLRTLNLVSRLAHHHEITYISHRNADGTEAKEAEEYLRDLGIRVLWVDRQVPPNSGIPFYMRLAGNLLSKHPYSVQRHASPQMQGIVSELDKSGQVDLWHVEWTPYAENLPNNLRAPWVVMAHNVETQIWRRYAEHESNPLKAAYIRMQARKFATFERDVFARADHLITVSDADAVLAKREYGASRVSVVNNGVDLDSFHPSGQGRDPRELLFLGSLGWRPNLDAVRLLLDRIFPAILKAEPNAKLTIVGRNPPPWLIERASAAPHVQLHASVPDVRPYLWRCGAMLVPLRIGGGTRLKILEALACQCPVISTCVGAEGLSLQAGVDFVEVAQPDEIAAAAVDGMRRYESLTATARSGYEVVQAEYCWDQLSEKLHAVWQAQAAPPVVAAVG